MIGLTGDKKLYYKNKERVYTLLGNKCNHCGIADVRVLQIDHVHGGGVTELKRIGNKRSYYSRVAKAVENGSDAYQLLCANCNWIKRHESQETGCVILRHPAGEPEEKPKEM